MLTKQENEQICLIDKGTPMGEIFRSVWLPAVPSAQVGGSGHAPVRLKILGEEMIAFRDGEGRAAIVQAQCAHRMAPLYYGRIEDRGIRCAYHGWLYDRTGRCVEIPSENSPEHLCARMSIKSYRVVEKADIVWIFMGEGEAPALPNFPWIDLPRSQRTCASWLQETNWLQGMEGEIDSSHVSVLHKSKSLERPATLVHRPYTFLDPRPKLFARETPIGFMSIARRRAEDQFYWRVTQWMMPMFSLVPSAIWPISGRAWIPIDNENTYSWDFAYSLDGDIPSEFVEAVSEGEMFPPTSEFQSYRLNTGTVIDVNVPTRTARNNYLIDRRMQAEDDEISGVRGINDQDRAMQEGMGRLPDRTREKLVAGDLTIVTARRRLLQLTQSADSIESFRALVADGSAFAHNPVDAVENEDNVDSFLACAEA